MSSSNSGSRDARRFPRKRMLKGGLIAFSNRHATLPCVVRDYSECGARLQVKVTNVPDTFELIIELDGLEVPAEVVWREPREIGVRFVAPPKLVPPKRIQTVTMTTPTLRKPSLRREPAHADAGWNAPVPAPAPVAPAAAAPAAAAVLPKRPAVRTPVIPVVVCDDDPDDRMLIDEAFHECAFRHPVSYVENGEELLKYLRAEAPYEDRDAPGLVLLDLNMPRMDGRTALMHLKTDTVLRTLPVIVMTTSNAEEDIQRTYELGVSAYIAKPSSHEGLIELVEALDKYWMRLVSLPQQRP